MWDAWSAGDRKRALEVIPAEHVDELIIPGSYEQCRAHIDRYVAAGVDIAALAIVPFGIDLAEAVTELAPR
jgi:alkanesulfonate monooxygenase SsuD/methylene tetrahydromethanopterin reductase-like flavin-dependent oxidoreductase (luciferase family)